MVEGQPPGKILTASLREGNVQKSVSTYIFRVFFRSLTTPCRLVFLTGSVHSTAHNSIFSLVEWTYPVRKTRRHGVIRLRKKLLKACI